jgi:hypothetical protein
MAESTWEGRMAQRHADRARQLAEANERENMSLPQDHLHGTMTACPCGAETGITCVAFGEDWVQPDPCEDCGKPVTAFCDGKPWRRDISRHVTGCPEHPETSRCTACGQAFLGTMVMLDSDIYHVECMP